MGNFNQPVASTVTDGALVFSTQMGTAETYTPAGFVFVLYIYSPKWDFLPWEI